MISKRIALALLALSLFGTGCSGSSSSEGGEEQDVKTHVTAPVSVNEFNALLGRMRTRSITPSDADAISRALVARTLTTEKMKLAFDFWVAGFKKQDSSPYQRGGSQLEILYWAMPRDLQGADASGQIFEEAIKTDPENDGDDPSPFTLKVTGTAKSAYTLTFTMSEERISVDIPQGTTAAATAALIAKAIKQHVDPIIDGATFKAVDNSGDFDNLTDIKARATKGKGLVLITPGIEG